MKAAVVHGPDQTPAYEEFEAPTPAPGLTVVRVAASALSNVTRSRAAGSHYSTTGGYPFVVGFDGVGRTESGERVAFMLPEQPFGGMAERTLVRDALLMPVPDELDDVLAAAVLNPGQSPIGALRIRADLQPGEHVLINGATGTTGQMAVQIARHLGAGRVVVTGRDTDALSRLRELGADDTIDLTGPPTEVHDALARHLGGGIDVVLDYLSGPPTETVLAAVADGHRGHKPLRYVVAGGAASTSTTVPTSVLGSTSILLMGSGIGAVRPPDIVRSAAEAMRITASAGLQLDHRVVPLTDVAQAWHDRDDRRRIVFTVPG